MAKKDPNDYTVEERLKLLYQLQTNLSAIDEANCHSKCKTWKTK